MIKVYVDDERKAPEGWHQCWNIEEAHDFIEENASEISHIDFDYYLSESMPERNGSLLIRNLIGMKHYGVKVFHQPIENYTFHSSDNSMNAKMKELVEAEFGIQKKIPKVQKSRLQQMRESKGRR